ncbi:DNA alkylation repair protein [bacterium]|nr:DNA alkylation repair protein [bacterium]
MDLKEVIKELKKNSNLRDKEGMVKFGINPKYALGVRVPILRKLAKMIGTDHKLAGDLWNTKIHEARILASMIEDVDKVTEKQMDLWVEEFNSWDLCDQCCMNLFWKTSFAFKKAIEWSGRQKEFVKRAGFALMAVLAWKDKGRANRDFLVFLKVIEKQADDNRNFVKKAINWALRQIGKRNKYLQKEAIKVAKRIQKLNSKSAKWIGSDALRELSGNRS